MNDKQAALVKLAQVRLAINYVLKQRGLTKQAFGDPLNDKYYDKNGKRNWSGFFSGVPSAKPQVTRIKGNDPGTQNTLMVTVPGKPAQTRWFNPASDQRHVTDSSDIDRNMMSAAAAGAGLGAGLGVVGGGPVGAPLGMGVGFGLGGLVGWPAATVKHMLNEQYRRDLRESLQAHGYNPDMNFGPK